jgi:hypothetical protein
MGPQSKPHWHSRSHFKLIPRQTVRRSDAVSSASALTPFSDVPSAFCFCHLHGPAIGRRLAPFTGVAKGSKPSLAQTESRARSFVSERKLVKEKES